jgi:hypothetical protein
MSSVSFDDNGNKLHDHRQDREGADKLAIANPPLTATKADTAAATVTVRSGEGSRAFFYKRRPNHV